MPEPFIRLTSHLALLPLDDVDTDQIIPARYLKVVDKQGLAEGLFAGWRYRPDGSPSPDFVLNRPEARGAQILLAGSNFGCGSSREHASWALLGWGFRAVVAGSFADIFRSNALKNGLLPVAVDAGAHQALLDQAAADARAQVTIDLPSQRVRLADGRTFFFPIDPFAKRCLLEGIDQLGYLLSFEEQVRAYEERHERA